jgi:hypothetical protein
MALTTPLLLAAACGKQPSASPGSFRESYAAGSVQQEQLAKTHAAPADAKPGEAAPVERKVIFTANLDVVVPDLDAARERLARLIGEYHAYVAKSEITGQVGARHSGSWTLRVPTDQFQPLIDAAAALGVAERNSTDSQDVTEEYVDTQSRLRNLKAEEETLNRLLKESAKSIADVLALRDQIRFVRGDIERSEGRLKALGNLTALATVHLMLREVKDYVPPTAPSPPTLGETVSRAWTDSVDALARFGKAVLLAVVALAPWVPLIVVAGMVLWFAVRWVARAPKPPLASVVPPAGPEAPATG